LVRLSGHAAPIHTINAHYDQQQQHAKHTLFELCSHFFCQPHSLSTPLRSR
jgi:hypothetical protein